MSSRVIYPSQQAIRKVTQALERDRFRHKTLEEIAELSPEVVSRFFQGKPISRSTLTKIYAVLELTLEERDITLELEESKNSNESLDTLIQKVRQHCCQKIQKRYSQTQLLNGKIADVRHLGLDVYKLEKLPRKSYITINHLLQNFEATQNFDRFGLGERKMRWSGLEVANQFPRLIVLGKRGLGKTTFLKHLAVACVRGQLKSDCIPVFLELKNFKDVETTQKSLLQAYLHQEFSLRDSSLTERILHSGKVLLLLDGLDEIEERSRRNVQYLIRTFSQKYYKNNFVLTCQTQATEYTFPTFEYCEVAEFDTAQIQQFAKVWFTALVRNPVKGESLKNQFITQLTSTENYRIAEIAVNPLILSLSCWLFSEQQELPRSRYNFYERALQLFLQYCQQTQTSDRSANFNLNLRDKLNLLSSLALILFENKKLFCEKSKVTFYIAGYLRFLPSEQESTQELLSSSTILLQQIEAQSGLILERSQKIYSFWSLDLHEYFVGRLILDNFNSQNSQEPLNPFTKKNWRESLKLAAQEMQKPDDLLLEIKQKVDGMLAVDKRLQIFLAWVAQKALLVEVSYKSAAVRAFYFSQAVSRIFQPKLARPLDFSHAVDRALKSDLHDRYLAYNLDGALDVAFKRNVTRQLDYDFLIDLILDCLLVTVAHDLNLFLTFSQDRAFDLDPDLKQSLKRFKNQLPDMETDRKRFQQWWKTNGKIWTQNLRMAIIQHRNIGYDWQFSEKQKELLKQYYEANKFLIDCLNSSPNTSSKVRQEIEETLLLPMSEIEERERGSI